MTTFFLSSKLVCRCWKTNCKLLFVFQFLQVSRGSSKNVSLKIHTPLSDVLLCIWSVDRWQYSVAQEPIPYSLLEGVKCHWPQMRLPTGYRVLVICEQQWITWASSDLEVISGPHLVLILITDNSQPTTRVGRYWKSKKQLHVYHARNNHDYHDYHTLTSNVNTAIIMQCPKWWT